MNFDPTSIQLNGISLIVAVFGLTQFIKESFDMSGKKVTFLAASVGAVVYVLYSLIGVLPEPYGQIVTIVFSSATFGLSASGYYKFAKSMLPGSNAPTE